MVVPQKFSAGNCKHVGSQTFMFCYITVFDWYFKLYIERFHVRCVPVVLRV